MTETRLLSIGQLARRAGVATSALRFYEEQGLIHSERSAANHRRYPADMLRRVAFIRAAQVVGLSLNEVTRALRSLPEDRTPTREDWSRLAALWLKRVDARIAELELLRDRLDGCIGCGCLSLSSCQLYNPGDRVATAGHGARFLMGDDYPSVE